MPVNIDLRLGDCLELMRQMPDKSVDLIVTDPPYGTTRCKWDVVIDFNQLWEQYKRIVTRNAAIILFGTEPFTSRLITSNIRWFKQRLIWKKHKPANFGCARYMFMKYTEDIVIFSSGTPTFNQPYEPRISNRVRDAKRGKSKNWNSQRTDGNEVSFTTNYSPRSWDCYRDNERYAGDVLEFPGIANNAKEKTGHPTQKPVRLLEYLVTTYSNAGETVLDNCMGSGSTGVACINTGRNFIGCEIDPGYYEIAKKRLGAVQEPLCYV